MLVIPSIDILGGKAVRLMQGKKESVQILGEPISLAAKYDALGFSLIHIVDLDAAFGGQNQLALLGKIAAACRNAKLQWGGGIRSFQLASQALELGAEKVVFGTAMFLSPNDVKGTAEKFGKEKVVAGLDFKAGLAQAKGWKEGTGRSVERAVALAEECGAGCIVATSVESDGMQKGPSLQLIAQVRSCTGLPIIASGGMRNPQDAREAAQAGAQGVIFGRALYGKEINWEELKCLQSE